MTVTAGTLTGTRRPAFLTVICLISAPQTGHLLVFEVFGAGVKVPDGLSIDVHRFRFQYHKLPVCAKPRFHRLAA